MRGASARKYDKPSKLQSEEAARLYPRQCGEGDKIIYGSQMLAAAIWRTGKVYRALTAEEKAEFERYAAQAVRVNIGKKK